MHYMNNSGRSLRTYVRRQNKQMLVFDAPVNNLKKD